VTFVSEMASKLLWHSVLKQLKEAEDSLGVDEREGLQVAVECLSNTFKVNLEGPDSTAYSLPVSLREIFEAGCKQLCPEALDTLTSNLNETEESKEAFEDSEHFKKFLKSVTDRGYFAEFKAGTPEYSQRYKKVLAKYKDRFGDKVKKDTDDKDESPENSRVADELKAEGNALLKSGSHNEALEKYTKAIELCQTGPNSHIYYCNRAAVYLILQKYEEAASDCSASIALKSDYVKAHSRLAQAYLSMGRQSEASDAANAALALDPNNAAAKSVLASTGNVANPMGQGGGNLPDMMGQMMNENPEMKENMMKMREEMLSGGGMPDIASMMNNPAMMNLAQSMMQNPAMMNAAQQMMSQFGGGSNPADMLNNPLMQQMMSDPNMMSNLAGMMGGQGGNSNNSPSNQGNQQ